MATFKGVKLQPAAKKLTKVPLLIGAFIITLVLVICAYHMATSSSVRQKNAGNNANDIGNFSGVPLDTPMPENFSNESINKTKKEPAPVFNSEQNQPLSTPTESKTPRKDSQHEPPPMSEPFPVDDRYQDPTPEKTPAEILKEREEQKRRERGVAAIYSSMSINMGSGQEMMNPISSALQKQFPQSLASNNQYSTQPQMNTPLVNPMGGDGGHQDQKKDFLENAAETESQVILSKGYMPPLSPYELKQGHLIPVTMLTEINSDLPGRIKAVVTETVYDSATGNYTLIPQGTFVNGVYDSKVVFGQSRVLVAWTRLIFPDGTSLNLESMPGIDRAGAAGLNDIVNNHYGRIFGGALLMSIINGALNYVADSGSSDSDKETVSDALAKSSAQQMQTTFSEIMNKLINIQPELIIRTGKEGHIIVTKDIIGLKPYDPRTKPTYNLNTHNIPAWSN